MGLDPLSIGLLAIAGAGTVGSISETRKAGKAAERQAQAEQRRAEIQNIRSVRQNIREARLAQASLINQGAISGTMGSTGVMGGLSSVSAQLGGNLNYISQIAEENTNIFNAALAGAKAQTNATIFGQVGQLAGSMLPQGSLGKQIGVTLAQRSTP